MLTVKICKGSGEELVFEAAHITREEGGILVQTETETLFYGGGGQQYALEANCRVCPAERDALSQADAAVYVMNRHGATVAQYRI